MLLNNLVAKHYASLASDYPRSRFLQKQAFYIIMWGKSCPRLDRIPKANSNGESKWTPKLKIGTRVSTVATSISLQRVT
jgi:hypothetical protein